MSATVIDRIYVRLSAPARQQLAERARAQRRHPSDEAALLLEAALQQDVRADATARGPRGESHDGN